MEVYGGEISVCLYGGGIIIYIRVGLANDPSLSGGSLVGVGLDLAEVRGGCG